MQKESPRTRGFEGCCSHYFAGGFVLRRCRNSIRRYSAAPKREFRSQFPLFPLDDAIRLMDDTEDHGVSIRIPVIHGFRFRWYPIDTQIKIADLEEIVPCLPPEEGASSREKSKTPAEGKIHTVRALSTYILTQALLDVNDLAMMIHEKQALHRPEATGGLSKLPLHNGIGQALHPSAVEDNAG